MGVKSPSVVVDAIIQPRLVGGPSMLSLPFGMDMIANDVVYRQGIDLKTLRR